jgi:hypothetical protein
MAATDKDLQQKRKAIQFCVASGLVPYYEVNITNVKDLTDKPEFLTDVDVLGVALETGRVKRIIFDCKTSKISPINRAFWASGLRQYVEAERAYVILKRSAPEAHKISAKTLGVHLFDEALFDAYATALSPNYKSEDDYLFSMERWHFLHDSLRANSTVEKLGNFMRHAVPLDPDAPKLVRGVLANLRHARGELDPARCEHMAVYVFAVFSFAVAMSTVARDIFDVFDPKQSRDAFERFLRDYIWEGREAYQLRKKLREVMASRSDHVSAEFELHAWEEFVELVRTLLDSPESVFLCCTPLLSCSLRFLASPEAGLDETLKRQLSVNNRQRQFVFRLSNYLAAACGLPRDLDDRLKAAINEVMA